MFLFMSPCVQWNPLSYNNKALHDQFAVYACAREFNIEFPIKWDVSTALQKDLLSSQFHSLLDWFCTFCAYSHNQ